MRLQQKLECAKPADDVLRRIRPVDANDELVGTTGGDLRLGGENLLALREFAGMEKHKPTLALNLVNSSAYDAAFFMAPTPIEHVQAVAAAGESMPPKSTYFFPKVPTGLVFNPLA